MKTSSRASEFPAAWPRRPWSLPKISRAIRHSEDLALISANRLCGPLLFTHPSARKGGTRNTVKMTCFCNMFCCFKCFKAQAYITYISYACCTACLNVHGAIALRSPLEATIGKAQGSPRAALPRPPTAQRSLAASDSLARAPASALCSLLSLMAG